VDDPRQTALLERALSYPYATRQRSYLYRGGGAADLPAGDLDLSGRIPLLAYGANCSPQALARKLAPLPAEEMPVLRAEIEGFDVVYSAHVSPYGAVPATLVECPGAVAPAFVLHPTPDQRALLTASEPNYDLVELPICLAMADKKATRQMAVYRSKHGCLQLDGGPVALAAVRARGRSLPELDEPAVLERVRVTVAPDLDLEAFIRRCVSAGGMRLG
jgi:hypothetical protein